MKRSLFFFACAALVAVAGCASEDAAAPTETGDDLEVIARDPLAMPKPVLDFLARDGWGKHHLEWHTVRQWDRIGKEGQDWAKGQGWARADIQEGQKGNGLEFLAMHRVMISLLVERFPKNKDLWVGWTTPPTDPLDSADPLPHGKTDAFDPIKAKALDKLTNDLDSFADDDALGLYIETSLRPTAQKPDGRATDKTAGVHNYLHVRWMDPDSKIDIGDPSVNLQNKRFWRIHGWLESRWTEYRKIKNRSDDDPKYQAAISKARAMLAGGGIKAPPGPYQPPPRSLTKFFENDEP